MYNNKNNRLGSLRERYYGKKTNRCFKFKLTKLYIVYASIKFNREKLLPFFSDLLTRTHTTELNTEKKRMRRPGDFSESRRFASRTSNSLDLLCHHNLIVLADLLTLDCLVVELAIMLLVVSMLRAIQPTAAARKSSKSNPFLAHVTAI